MEKYNLTQTGAEVQRILNEAVPQSEITAEVERAQGAEQTLQDNIDAEELRAKAAEHDLEQADTVLQGNIDAEELRAKAAEKQNADDIDVIEEKIPTEASGSNQLADKAFVNSSIASNTATYRGSFNQVNDLHLTLEATEADIATALESVIDNADNNDYCYLQVPVSESAPTEIAQVDRYKFNGTTWAYEYTLNNSGFTADQWAALNSAITSGLVAKLSALPNMTELTALLAGKQNLLNFDNVPTTGSNNPVTSGGVKTAIDDEKTRAQAAEQANNLLITQINGKIPSDATSENKLVDKAYVDAADATMQSAIEEILALIPEAATALNQLADKAFVNSSIATNTGTFKGTYNVVLDLELFYDATQAQIALMLASKITSAKNNDYCYVQVPNSNEDPTSINHTDRYKYNGTAWAYEYTLNNSGFTTAQWAAINSGITELLKNKLVDLPTATELAALLNAKQNTLTFDTAPTPNSTNPVTSDGIHAAINVEKERAEAAEEELDTNKADKATTLAGYGITDAYTKNEVNNMITTPNQQYVTVATYASLPASGSKDTIYRVSNYNGANSQVDNTVYSEYAWNGTQYVFLCVKSQIEEVFDITVYNSNTKYADLAAALGVDGANIPATLRRGGMSVKFVQSSDNKYIQARCMAQNFTTDVTQWQGVDDEPTAGSDNLVTSGGVERVAGSLQDKSNAVIAIHHQEGYSVYNQTGNCYSFVFAVDKDAVFSGKCTFGKGMRVSVHNTNDLSHVLKNYDKVQDLTSNAFTQNDVEGVINYAGYLKVSVHKDNDASISDSEIPDIVSATSIDICNYGTTLNTFRERETEGVPTKDSKKLLESGGVYLTKKAVDETTEKSNNLFDVSSITTGSFLNPIYHNVVTDSNRFSTEKIAVTAGQVLYFNRLGKLVVYKNGAYDASLDNNLDIITDPWTVPSGVTEIVLAGFISDLANPSSVDYPYISVGERVKEPYGYYPKTSTGVDESSNLPVKSKDVYTFVSDRISEHVEENAEYLAAEVDNENRCYRSISDDKETHYLPQVFKDKVILSKSAYDSLVESAYNFGIPEVCELEFGEKVAVFSAEDEDATTMDDIRAQDQVIIKVNGMYYMYYFAYGTEGYRPWDSSTQGKKPYNTLFAYSYDGENWTRGFPQGVTPPFGDDYPNSVKFLDNNMNVMQSHYGPVLKVEDAEYPLRMISSEGYLIMFKSADGFTWVNPVVIDNTQYRDTMSGVEYRNGVMKIYTRGWSGNYPPLQTNGYGSRMIVVLYCDKDGNMICPAVPFASRASNYDSPLAIIDDRRVLLLPTLYQGDDIRTVINGYIVDGAKVNKIPIDNDFLLYNEDAEEGEQENYWKYISFVSNSFCENGKLYMYYNVGNQPHNTWATDNPHVVCKLYRVEIKLKSKVITNIENLV